jgi:hypothetical protein
MEEMAEHLDIGDLGAFVDTQGSTKRRKRRKKLSEASDDTALESYSQEERDEVEARLESLVFGGQPFQTVHSEPSSSSDEVSQTVYQLL